MIKYITAISLLLSQPNAAAGITLQNLQLNQEKIISTTLGILQPNLIISLNVGDSIKFYFPDGAEETGIVKSKKEEKDSVRIFGEILNRKDCGFGFGLTPSIFAGAVVYQDDGKIYEAKFDGILGGFIFRLKIPNAEI
jgi:hypothetical protein